MGRRLLERDAELSTLASAARDAAAGNGSVVLVHGEAGIGKSSLVSALKAAQPAQGRTLVGSCDALSTPRTLGPLRDLVPSVGPRLAGALTGGDREQVFAALHDELGGGSTTTLVVEDVHWADEATLDTLRFLVRRIEALPAVLVLTYRDDELERDHPLSQLLGDLGSSANVHRLALKRLSEQAVAALTAGSELDPRRVHALTEGNPYFVTELVATADEASVPPTVVDAVLSRLGRLDRPVQEAVEQLALVPSAIDRPLLELLVPGGLQVLSEAEERGLLTVRPDGVRFRHELTRRAVVDALPVARRVELSVRALAALEEAGVTDPSRLVHHAREAGDAAAVARYAPEAAHDASASGAHREAAAHFALALTVADRYPRTTQAELCEGCAVEQYTIGLGTQAIGRQRRAVELRRELGVPTALGASLRWLSRMLWFAGDRRGAEQAAREATTVLEGAGDPGLLALAMSNESQLAMLAHRAPEAIEIAERAIPLARQAGDLSVLSHLLTNRGSARLFLSDEGIEDLREAARVALEVDDVENASRAFANLAWTLLDLARLDEADAVLEEALEHARRAEYLGFMLYLEMELARLELARGHWDSALRIAGRPLEGHPQARCVALTVIGAVRVRRGEGGADSMLEEARVLSEQLDEIQRTGPVAAVRAEAAVLGGDLESAAAIAAPMYDEAVRLADRPLQAELAYRLRQAGKQVAVPELHHPFALQARGRWQEAAAAWRRAGCPYHEAAALADSPQDDDLLAALFAADRMGAVSLGRRIRAELRQRGVRSVPRGPAAETRGNPLGLTDRQLDVLGLLAEGLTNAAIANRLVVSVRTVDSHVAAVLGKLGVATRQEARARAAELGLVPER